jgi:hypothetical protein
MTIRDWILDCGGLTPLFPADGIPMGFFFGISFWAKGPTDGSLWQRHRNGDAKEIQGLKARAISKTNRILNTSARGATCL